jgi:hypothetical protein
LTELLLFRPTERGQELAQQRAVRAIERAFEARENRIRLSKSRIAPIQWVVIVHIGRPAAMAITLFIF